MSKERLTLLKRIYSRIAHCGAPSKSSKCDMAMMILAACSRWPNGESVVMSAIMSKGATLFPFEKLVRTISSMDGRCFSLFAGHSPRGETKKTRAFRFIRREVDRGALLSSTASFVSLNARATGTVQGMVLHRKGRKECLAHSNKYWQSDRFVGHYIKKTTPGRVQVFVVEGMTPTKSQYRVTLRCTLATTGGPLELWNPERPLHHPNIKVPNSVRTPASWYCSALQNSWCTGHTDFRAHYCYDHSDAGTIICLLTGRNHFRRISNSAIAHILSFLVRVPPPVEYT